VRTSDVGERSNGVLYGQEHIDRYRATGGEEGHEWMPGVYALLLTTRGRTSGKPHTAPLIYQEDGEEYVIVASKGGHPDHPDWYLNLQADAQVEIQVGPDVMQATARTVEGEDRTRLWQLMTEVWPQYDEYAQKTERDIPVVVLTPAR
jgi:deazaflavin-dependent oxidoreductase (nitroreductase family)